MQFVDEAARLLNKAGLYETVNEVYKAVIPIAEANRSFTKLAEIHNVSKLGGLQNRVSSRTSLTRT